MYFGSNRLTYGLPGIKRGCSCFCNSEGVTPVSAIPESLPLTVLVPPVNRCGSPLAHVTIEPIVQPPTTALAILLRFRNAAARRGRERCRAAGVPGAVELQTKPELARQMIGRALDAGVPVGWVAGDEVYGTDSKVRRMLEARQVSYVLAVACNQHLWWPDFQQQ